MLAIIQHGYCLEPIKTPPNIPPHRHILFKQHQTLLKKEVQALLQKGAIETVLLAQQGSILYCLYFLIPKRDGSHWPILDLRPLN